LRIVGDVSGTNQAIAAAIAVSPSATSQTAPKPTLRCTISPIAGPIPSPTYSDSDSRFSASPRRLSGERSAPAAKTATKKNASAIPRSARATMNSASESTNRCTTSAPHDISAPARTSGRRPYRSDAHPTTGRSTSAPTCERAVRDACPDLVRPERAGRERRDHRQHDAAGHEEHERRRAQDDERGGKEPLGICVGLSSHRRSAIA
jgi:hypothetical protein